MEIPKILFLTCMPLEQPRSASMAFMGLLLEKYPQTFSWFSLHPPAKDSENSYNIPYYFGTPIKFPSRFPWLKNLINNFLYSRLIAQKAAEFGRMNKTQLVLADLAFESVIAGRLTAKRLGVPLLVMVHDDPVNRIRNKGFPAWLVKLYEREFVKTLRSAHACAVISDYMGQYYRQKYSVETVTLFPGVDPDKCLKPRRLSIENTSIVIGSIGSINSKENWDLLINAIYHLNQRVGSIMFRILHIGSLPQHLALSPIVEVTGWLPEDEFIKQLKRIDIGFLNWTFDPAFSVTVQTSLPLKITSYIQAQVPMLALGPEGSSIIRFVMDHQCGFVCSTDSLERLTANLQRFLSDLELINNSMESVKELKEIYSLEQFYKNFEEFIYNG